MVVGGGVYSCGDNSYGQVGASNGEGGETPLPGTGRCFYPIHGAIIPFISVTPHHFLLAFLVIFFFSIETEAPLSDCPLTHSQEPT